MTYDSPELDLGEFRLVFEDIDGHPTNGIPSIEITEVKGFLKDAIRMIATSSKAAMRLQQEANRNGNLESVCVTVSHTMNRFTALATYHLRIYSDKKILLDCERERVGHSEGAQSARITGYSCERVGKLEPKDP